MEMQREAYTAHQSCHAQQLQQEQPEFTHSQQMSNSDEEIKAESIQLSDMMPLCPALSESSLASSQDDQD